jgi:pimeloyl-ACP methyl ester carboxylesterase
MGTFNPDRLILIHGLEGSSQGDKATLLRSIFPQMMTPDFRGPVEERMELLYSLLGKDTGWTIIGSSLGGLMAALFTTQHPDQVRKQILLAPALFLPEFASDLPEPVDVPTVIYHGTRDEIVPIEQTRILAKRSFTNLTINEVDDDHRLFNTVHAIDWKNLLN